MTAVLTRNPHTQWMCLEPDATMVRILGERIRTGDLPSTCTAEAGVVADLPRTLRFDTILYIDVLEHIAADAEELAGAARHLERGGTLIVVAPANEWLYSPFDVAIGHHRRYSRASLRAAAPATLDCVALRYLDSAGLLVSLGNRLLLRRGHPTAGMIRLWDRWLIPGSRVLDPLVRFAFGRSVLGIWQAD